MNYEQIRQINKQTIKSVKFERLFWNEYDFKNILPLVESKYRKGNTKNRYYYSTAVIMLDTETSKDHVMTYEDGKPVTQENHICMFSLAVLAESTVLCALWGRTPYECIQCLDQVIENLNADRIYIYVHFLSYDWTFLRKFLIQAYGEPVNMLCTKSHNPISIEFENGLVLRDSYILAQRGLEKWGEDLCIEHKKAVGAWDYDKIRNQDYVYSDKEILYSTNDVIAGVECIDKMLQMYGDTVDTIPLTATGYVRRKCRKAGVPAHARNTFKKIAPSFDTYIKLEKVFHGGYTHANRHMLSRTHSEVKGYDFASSYPYCMIAERFPMGKFCAYDDCKISDILDMSDDYAFIFKLILIRPRLKSDSVPMPSLQLSKAVKTINPVIDNGRILCAGYVEIYLNEIDLFVIASMYDYDKDICVEVEYSPKKLLPKWLRDFVYTSFQDKTLLKGGDPVLYAIAKAMLNSIYGMCVQKPLRDEWHEDFNTGEYLKEIERSAVEWENYAREKYDKYLSNRNSILPYQWGVWVTSYAFRNLFELGKCFSEWIYSDTDSVYGLGVNEDKINAYNKAAIKKVSESGYDGIDYNGRTYYLGIAEHDDLEDTFSEFRTVGAKRYVDRPLSDGKLHITVAGVPKKKGADCLENDINRFREGFIFYGDKTGKSTHTYFFPDSIHKDRHGNYIGDSIDLTPCDYKLDTCYDIDWESIFNEEMTINEYENN